MDFIDSRVFVYVHRNDNYVKPEAVITGGCSNSTTAFGADLTTFCIQNNGGLLCRKKVSGK